MIMIGVTDTLKPTLENYRQWIQSASGSTAIIVFSPVRRNLQDLARCDGLVLTGGGDIHPAIYDRPDADAVVKDVNRTRDDFEIELFAAARERNLPVLGICRGMQLVNVACGGSLIPDLPAAGFGAHGKQEGLSGDGLHEIGLLEGTRLRSLVGVPEGVVNSSHHQAVDRPGRGLRVAAASPDGVIEALEWDGAGSGQFLQLVQWHPERMKDRGSPFSRRVLEGFLVAAASGRRAAENE